MPFDRSLLVLAAFAIVGTGCSSPASPSRPDLHATVTLAPGESASLGGSVSIGFNSVVNDSRCPADVVCIQGGDALVHIRVPGEVDTVDYELHTGDTSRASVAHGAARIELLELQPYPFSSKTIAPEDYRATLRVTRP